MSSILLKEYGLYQQMTIALKVSSILLFLKKHSCSSSYMTSTPIIDSVTGLIINEICGLTEIRPANQNDYTPVGRMTVSNSYNCQCLLLQVWQISDEFKNQVFMAFQDFV